MMNMWEPLDVADVRWQFRQPIQATMSFLSQVPLFMRRLSFCQDGCCQHLLFSHEKGEGVHVNHTPQTSCFMYLCQG